MTTIRIREAKTTDQDFLWEMLYQSIFLAPGSPKPIICRKLGKARGLCAPSPRRGTPGKRSRVQTTERTAKSDTYIGTFDFVECSGGESSYKTLPEVRVLRSQSRKGFGNHALRLVNSLKPQDPRATDVLDTCLEALFVPGGRWFSRNSPGPG